MNITEITAPRDEARTLRLAAYCRVSSASEDQLHSFAAQIKYYTDYAGKQAGCKLVDIYANEGLSGTNMKKRDELNRLIRDCKKGKVDRIITKSVSRFARNTQELLTINEIYTILDAMSNHPMHFDDSLIRQLLECVVVESKEQIKVVFVGGLEVIQPLNA